MITTLTTPLGSGTFQGKFADGRLLVRLTINNQTAKHLRDANCLTPKAKRSGLWLFDKEQVKA